jgi:hypothetical protein
MLASDLTPAVKLVLLVAAEQITGYGDVPMSHADLGRRLNMAPRTVRGHFAQARAERWLSAEPTIRAAPGRAAHYRAQMPVNGGYAPATVAASTVAGEPAPFTTRERTPSHVDSGYAPATVNRAESDNGVCAPATVPIETPDQPNPWAAGAPHLRTAAAQTNPEHHPTPSLRSSPDHNGTAAAAPADTADVVASRGDHKRASGARR